MFVHFFATSLLLVSTLLCCGQQVSALTLGIDSTCSGGVISQASFTTAKNAGYVNFVGQYFDGTKVTNANTISGITAGVNYNAIKSIANADIALTLSNRIDAYHTPRFAVSQPLYYPFLGTYTNIYAQARRPVDKMNSNNGQIGRTWLVILQNAGSGWLLPAPAGSANQLQNRAFVTEFLGYFPQSTASAKKAPLLGPEAGVLSNKTDFEAILGADYVPKDGNGNPIELWWQACNGDPSNNGYEVFGGWSDQEPNAMPRMHQYSCSQTNIAGSGINGNLDSHQ